MQTAADFNKLAMNKALSIPQRTSDQMALIKRAPGLGSKLDNSTSGDCEAYSAPSDQSRTAQIEIIGLRQILHGQVPAFNSKRN